MKIPTLVGISFLSADAHGDVLRLEHATTSATRAFIALVADVVACSSRKTSPCASADKKS